MPVKELTAGSYTQVQFVPVLAHGGYIHMASHFIFVTRVKVKSTFIVSSSLYGTFIFFFIIMRYDW